MAEGRGDAWYWEACADYADGTSIRKLFPYDEGDIYKKEDDRQHELEEWLLSRHDGCTWYSVELIEEEGGFSSYE